MDTLELSRDFTALLEYLRENRGFDFTGYKPSSLMRRIGKRMQMVNVQGYVNYIDYLEVHPDEFTHLFNTILINVTAFFRDSSAWEYLAQEIMPQLIVSSNLDPAIRVWSAGCASGEETYTLAMMLAEALGVEAFRERVKIFATDADEEALQQARQGTYSSREVAGIPPELLEKYFEYSNDHYSFNKELRRSLIFGRHDLIQDPPISRIDLLVCRNTLMYFNTETQNHVLQRFYFSLKDNSYLFLGKAEMLFNRTNLFTPINLKQRIFAKVPQATGRDSLLFRRMNPEEAANSINYQQQLYETAFNVEPLAQIVVDFEGLLRLANHQAQALLNLTPRDLNRPLQELPVSYRPVGLLTPIQQVCTEYRPIVLKNIEWGDASGETRFLEVQLLPLLDNKRLLGVKVIFTDITLQTQLQQELQQTNQELETAFEELQSTNEELETTNEELQSANEELETTNEELQSTNEELETMNEELQSTNEELETINEELGQRSSELNTVNTFLTAILTSLRSGVIVLNQDLLIQAWNARAEDLWGLRAEEVQGTHFLNLEIGLPVEQLRSPIRACLGGEVESQEVLLAATNRRGKAVTCKVTCTPLINRDRQIQGAILLMEEIAPS